MSKVKFPNRYVPYPTGKVNEKGEEIKASFLRVEISGKPFWLEAVGIYPLKDFLDKEFELGKDVWVVSNSRLTTPRADIAFTTEYEGKIYHHTVVGIIGLVKREGTGEDLNNVLDSIKKTVEEGTSQELENCLDIL